MKEKDAELWDQRTGYLRQEGKAVGEGSWDGRINPKQQKHTPSRALSGTAAQAWSREPCRGIGEDGEGVNWKSLMSRLKLRGPRL